MIKIKEARNEDLEWVNATYSSIKFLPSSLKDEIVAIAYESDQKFGLGRISVIDDKSCELGGMYVDPKYRRRGIARDIVTYLLENAQKSKVYCIPFLHLEHFYASFGFKRINEGVSIPTKIAKKFQFCKETYAEETILMVRE